jgi:hypothetical protein
LPGLDTRSSGRGGGQERSLLCKIRTIAARAEQDATKLIGAIGVLGFAVPGISSLLFAPTWRFPGTNAAAAEITAYVVEHRTALLAGVVLDTVGVALWGVFGTGVWLRLRRATGGETLLSACFALGLVAFVTLLLAGFAFFLVLTYRAQHISDPRLLYDISFGLLAISGLPTAVALGSYAALTVRTGHLPRWTAMLAAVSATAHVLLLASFLVKDGFFSLEGQAITVIPATLFIWILGTGVAMLRVRPGAGSSTRPGPTEAPSTSTA